MKDEFPGLLDRTSPITSVEEGGKVQAESRAACMQCIDKLALPVAETARGVENSVKPLAHATQGRPGVGNPGGGGSRVAEAV